MKVLSPKRQSLKVFISYSHDSVEHMDRVLALSDRLRQDGIDCHIDQYETSPREGWPRWMQLRITKANFVLVICTETYRRRFSGQEKRRRGLGVKWEGAILTQELYDAEANNTKFVPVFVSSHNSNCIPIILRGATYYEVNTERGYEDLYRRLTNQPDIPLPEIGKIRPMPPRKRKEKFSPVSESNGQPSKSKGQWVIKLNARLNDSEVLSIFAKLQELSGDIDLKLQRVNPGSVTLVLEGSQVGFERIKSLFIRGKLADVLGTDILDLRWDPQRSGEDPSKLSPETTSMNKTELVSTMAKEAGITRGQAEKALDSMQSSVVDAIRKGEKVTLVGFGTFSTVQRKARTGRNPQTGLEIRIPAKRVPKFAPGVSLRDAASKGRAAKK